MNTYIAMLRGVNVSGHNKVAMADLRALFDALGHSEVQTYIQSGNVVFKSASTNPASLAQAIEQACAKRLGVDVTVVLRTRAELTRTASSNPFLKRGADPARLHVTFLAE